MTVGTSVLAQLMEEVKKTVVLEIDPLVSEVAKKRLTFYQKLGFKLCPYKHLHPAYRKAYAPHELLVLSSGSVLPPALYERFKNDLSAVVMEHRF